MKKFFIVMCMMLVSATSFAQKGEMDLGVNAAFFLDSPNNIGLGANVGYMLMNNVRGVAEFDYYLKKDGVSIWNLGANAEYLFKLNDEFAIYPLVGLNIMGWSWDGGSDTKLGMNLGGGVEYAISSNLKLRGEIVYKTQGDGNTVVKAGVVIPF